MMTLRKSRLQRTRTILRAHAKTKPREPSGVLNWLNRSSGYLNAVFTLLQFLVPRGSHFKALEDFCVTDVQHVSRDDDPCTTR